MKQPQQLPGTMEDNIITLTFADRKVPEFKETYGSSYIKFDTDDKYPLYLIYLLNKSAKHNAIIGGKTTYIYGGGLKVDTPEGGNPIADPKADAFINRYGQLIKKKITDLEAFGMMYIQCIPTRGGTGWGFYHISYERMRSNKDASEFYYKKDWQDRREVKQCFPSFDPAVRVNSIFMYKEYRPGNGVYGLPGFVASCNYIEADIEVSKHTLTNAQSGWSASKFINFYNGEPTEAIKRSIEGRFTGKFTGSQGNKIILGFNSDPAKRPTVDDLGASDLTKEDFSQVDNLISTNLYAGHQITSPQLFGIPAQDKGIGSDGGNELRVAYELFKATYVAGKKLQIETIINFLAYVSGVTSQLSLVDVEPVGYQFSESTILKVAPRSWLLEKLGIDTTKYTDEPVEGGEAQPGVSVHVGQPSVAPSAQEAAVNDNLKNLTAKQHQQLLRIIRQYTKQQITREMATVLLKSGLGLSDEDINKMLPAVEDNADAFSGDEDVALLFASHGEPRTNFSAYERRVANFGKAEFKEYSDVEDKINVVRKANPKATPSSIAKQLNIDEAVVTDYINSGGGGTADVVKKLPKFEVRYSYEKRPEVSGPEVLPTTRPFCKKMLSLDRFYSRQDIQKISVFLGYDVMKRAGGFWNNNGEVEYHCRHEFFSHIVIRKK